VSGSVAYALLALVGTWLPQPVRDQASWVLLLGATFAAIWYLRPSLPFPSPRTQVARLGAVYVPVVGGLIFGSALGVGLITVISTPLVLVGAAFTTLLASPLLGAVYGLSFGLGRALQLVAEFVVPESDHGLRVRRAMVAQRTYGRGFGLVVSCLLGVWALLPPA
jgi:hypothetical protein